MKINGEMLIGGAFVQGTSKPFYAINPKTNHPVEPAFHGASIEDVNSAAKMAHKAFDIFRSTTLEARARFLETCANEIQTLSSAIIERAMVETGLPQARLTAELGRTTNQLRFFAKIILQGDYLDLKKDPELPLRHPVPRADMRQTKMPLGPVAVFGASNFPLAFSVAGGDTASALAAGCPVIVKAHSAHPGTSELVARAIHKAIERFHLPPAVFSLLYDSGYEVGTELVKHPYIKAVGFTGSQMGGTTLMKVANDRDEPIPVYAEMSSVNPVFLLPDALSSQHSEIADAFVTSLTQSAGQLCTNPGLIIAIQGKELDDFIQHAKNALTKIPPQTMLTPAISDAYQTNVWSLIEHPKVTKVASGQETKEVNQCQAQIYRTTADTFINNSLLQRETFGACCLIVECSNSNQFKLIAEQLEGQLTASIHMNKGDYLIAQTLLPTLERKAGRIVCNDFPTGVEVGYPTVHGGPFPATSDSRSTSVGAAAIERFLRPICYQNLPQILLPEQLQDKNLSTLPHTLDGKRISC